MKQVEYNPNNSNTSVPLTPTIDTTFSPKKLKYLTKNKIKKMADKHKNKQNESGKAILDAIFM